MLTREMETKKEFTDLSKKDKNNVIIVAWMQTR
jgi:hypothetical protein